LKKIPKGPKLSIEKETTEWSNETRDNRMVKRNKRQQNGQTKQETTEWSNETRENRMVKRNKRQQNGQTKQETTEWSNETRGKDKQLQVSKKHYSQN
jgi:hypothetical protein